MTKKSGFVIILIVIILPAVIGLGYLAISWFLDVTPVNNSLEQYECVEVIGKRIREHSNISGEGSTTYTYIVAFKFSDGSVKEFDVDTNGGNGNRREVYDSFYVGDTGILTYKERANIEEHIKTENMRWNGRRFISFEKDF